MIIPAPIADQGFFQALCRIEAGGRQHLAEAAIKALNHAVGLRMAGLDQPVFDAVLITGAVAAMTSGRITLPGGATAIGEFLAVIRPHLVHLEGRFIDESLKKGGRMGGGFLAENFHVHPARGPVDRTKRSPCASASGSRGRDLISTWTKPGS